MDQGTRSGCEIVPGKDTSIFQFRVWLSSPEDIRPTYELFGDTKIVVGGHECTAYYVFVGGTDPIITLALIAPLNRALGGSAKVSAHMVLLDKTGSPAASMARDCAQGRLLRSECSLG
jgi:hypothetical protein